MCLLSTQNYRSERYKQNSGYPGAAEKGGGSLQGVEQWLWVEGSEGPPRKGDSWSQRWGKKPVPAAVRGDII